MHSSRQELDSPLVTLTFILLVATTWLIVRGYHGLTGDGQIYAFQALARLRPQLAGDLYLLNVSQDRFTVFSPFYAATISLLGLEGAARFLTLFFTGWLLTAAWCVVRALASRDIAWLAAAFLLIIEGNYGGAGVFRISEPYLTARLPAEALVVTALACQIRGWARTSRLVAVAALFVHPIMALPGLLLIVCLQTSTRIAVALSLVAIATTLGICLSGKTGTSHLLQVMDSKWLDVVRERSQFLFLPLWSFRDWQINMLPFVSLGFTAMTVDDSRIRKLCLAAALVGVCGLIVALLAGGLGPVALLIQGQAWRWVWIPLIVSALLVPISIFRASRDDRLGPTCATLVLIGWTASAIDGLACISLAVSLWAVRHHLGERWTALVRWIPVVLTVAVCSWTFAKSGTSISEAISISGTTGVSGALSAASASFRLSPGQISDFFSLRFPVVILVAAVYSILRQREAHWGRVCVAAGLIGLSALVLPAAFSQARTFGSAADKKQFEEWIRAIPPSSTVLMIPPRDSGAFVWFTLERPNYLALNQSAGVVFSRETSLEVVRRSEVLASLIEPEWKILTHLRSKNTRKATSLQIQPDSHRLTAEKLRQICLDPRLDFVISPQAVGFQAIRHAFAGALKNWNLYDCHNLDPA